MATGVATYYDRLLRWNRVARAFGYGGGAGDLTVHRALTDPRAGGRPTFTRLHDILVERLPACAAPRVLDAGCGLGGTMIALAQSMGATCLGLTLSRAQAEAANAAALRHNLGSWVRAVVGSYDDPPAGPFDVIVAIESLAHSANPALSVSALTRVLSPGGLVAVVDDMPEPQVDGSLDLDTFRRGWACPVLWSRADYLAAFAQDGLEVVDDSDLSSDCRPRPSWRIGLLLALNAAFRRVAPVALRQVLESHRGGLALERLLQRRHVRYRLLVAKRPELRVS